MDEHELRVQHFLEDEGFEVTHIPESATKTCDFIAHDHTDTYLVEVKTREEEKTIHEDIQQQGFAMRTNPAGRTNVLQHIIEHGIRQIDSIEEEPTKTYKIVWCVLHRVDEEFAFTQLRSTVYGIENILCTRHGEQLHYECSSSIQHD